MNHPELEPGDEDFLSKYPICNEGYMIPSYGGWYHCSNCGEEAKEDDYGILWFDN